MLYYLEKIWHMDGKVYLTKINQSYLKDHILIIPPLEPWGVAFLINIEIKWINPKMHGGALFSLLNTYCELKKKLETSKGKTVMKKSQKCQLEGHFNKFNTLFILVLWLLYDQNYHFITNLTKNHENSTTRFGYHICSKTQKKYNSGCEAISKFTCQLFIVNIKFLHWDLVNFISTCLVFSKTLTLLDCNILNLINIILIFVFYCICSLPMQ